MEKDELIRSKIEDCVRRCTDGYYTVATRFLDSHEQYLASSIAGKAAGVNAAFYGGYDEAERRMLICIPSGSGFEESEAKEGLLKVLRITTIGGGRRLSHRDYLGSVLGLGLDRSVVGDILVRDDGADMIIVQEIADFLMQEYTRVGSTDIKTELAETGELIVPEAHVQVIKDTVSSARLDNIVSSAFKLSRTKAAEAVRSGIVSVNHMENTRPDSGVNEGDTVVLRGKGKAVVTEIGGESKKGRIWVNISRYVD